MSWESWVRSQHDLLHSQQRWRSPRVFDAAGPSGWLADARREVTSFASNDYLGLSQHPAVKEAACAAVQRWGTGAGASRLVVGSRPVHHELEEAIAAWKGCEAAAVFPTGFSANLGVISTFGASGVRICSDELNHASIIDGCRLARAEVCVYRHCDLDELAKLVAPAPQALVVTDAVFSMDGDLAPIEELAELCAVNGALLVVDEAHSVLGPEVPNGPRVLRVGTLSKALGSLGGFVAGPRRLVELVVNRARSYIFTTALTPADSAAALASLRIFVSGEGRGLRERLRSNVEILRQGHPSPIVAVIVGDERAALDASARLLERGIWVPAIRPPTVAEGTSRLRVALSATHTPEQVRMLSGALADLGLG